MSFQFDVVSTFAGCGGSSLGYKLAGGKILLAVEYEKSAIQTYQMNYPATPMFGGDIKDLSVEKCLTMIQRKPGELDILDGSPPCQGFSTAGDRVFGDERNQLFREYVRLLRGLQPKVFVMENVKGLVIGKMKVIFAEMLRELKESGYSVKAQLLNAMYFGVPQSRERMIICGVRNDLGISPTLPRPQTRPKTVGEAIGHLPIGKPGNHKETLLGKWSKAVPNRSINDKKYSGSLFGTRIDGTKPSPTLNCNDGFWHYAVPRKLTIQEAAILQSFPEDYKWPKGRTEAMARIGNSVPPLMMKAIAEHIRDNILSKVAS